MYKVFQTLSALVTATIITMLAACTVAPTNTSLKAAQLPTMLPVRDFVANTDYNGMYRISPDGKKLAWQAVSGLTESTFVKTLDSGEVNIISIKGDYLWAQDSRHLLFYRDNKGNENYHILMVDTANPSVMPKDLTPFESTRAYVQQVIETDPQHVLIAHNRRDSHVFDLVKINLATAQENLIATNPGKVARWLTDSGGTLWGRILQSGEGYQLELLNGETQAWRSIYRWDRFDAVAALALTENKQEVWMLSNHGRDLRALVKLNLVTGMETIVYQHSIVDVGDLLYSKHLHEPVLANLEPDYPQLKFLNSELESDLATFVSAKPQGLRVTSMDDQDRRITVELYTSIGKQFYLFDRKSKQTLP